MHQQDGHVHYVEVRQQVLPATGQAVGQRPHQVARVVHVSGHSPETGGEQLALVDAAVRRAIGALDITRLAAPDPTVALCAAEQVLLMVGGAEDVVTPQAEDEDPCNLRGGELDGVVDQVQALQETITD